MRAPKPIRLAAVAATVLLLVAAGCNRGDDDDDNTPEPTSSSPAPDVDAVGDFQLVGTIEQAFVDVAPEIDVPSGDNDDDSLGSESTASPQPTASGDFVTPPVNGIMRISLDDASAALRDRCSADRDEDIEVFWTTATEFARRLLGTDIEETLDRRLVGVIGNLYVGPRPDSDDDDGLGLGQTSTQSPGATAQSPGATAAADAATAEDRGCVLIADQVGTSTGAIPTARPRGTARPTTRPAATRSPTPRPPTPTPVPPTSTPPTPTPTSPAPT
jgi:hypothetical protein